VTPTLSVLCPTRDAPHRVRAALEPLRDVADEIVVAGRCGQGPDDLSEYAAVADRLLRYERGPTHSSLAWLTRQCRGDWILLLAGDEVVGPGLRDALVDLIASRDVLHYSLPFRWVHPDGRRWLAEAPWHPDHHVRLMRNDGTLRFAGRKHELALPVLPARTLELPLWHLNLVLLDTAQRRRKVARNEAERPGLLTADGRPFDATQYLPEEGGDLRAVPIPDGDLAAIRAVLAATPAAGTRLTPDEVPLVTRPEIERLWAGRTMTHGAYHARVEPLTTSPGPRGRRRRRPRPRPQRRRRAVAVGGSTSIR
jgi:hypothetical protein